MVGIYGEMKLMTDSYNEYYKRQLEIGLEFQDHVAEILFKQLGILLATYNSKR